MATVNNKLPAHLDQYPYYFIGLMSVGGAAMWWGRSNAVTHCYSDRMKFMQHKQATPVAQGLIDSYPQCDIFVCMVATLGFVSTVEIVHQHRLTTITKQDS